MCTSKVTTFSCLLEQSWMHISFICMALKWSQGEMSWWSLKKVSVNKRGIRPAECSVSGGCKEELKPAPFFLESASQVIINKKDCAFWQASGGTLNREIWLWSLSSFWSHQSTQQQVIGKHLLQLSLPLLHLVSYRAVPATAFLGN